MLPQMMQFVSVGLLFPLLHIPPPIFPAEFPVKVQFHSVGLLQTVFRRPAPFRSALLPVNLQFISVGEASFSQEMPPPSLIPCHVVLLSMKTQLIIVGLQ